ncbi:phosphoglycerate mutase family protein GPM2 [Saccharomyces eubayanus]|uniref:phosphoglycerate mutase family protein GPM2 n=1 Tax=Saccharomyces eubayanus TaxID=1080349 RepID=UPI0006BFAC18|nr:GPM2-like protein [Saccharomyces eubayanus]KOH00330.1 GPM2-like protein [Saccharomyces eubayanus]
MTANTKSNVMRLFLLRHGQSELNHENIFCGWIDAKLTEKGKEQARHSAELIKQYCETNQLDLPQIGYTSRLIRTQQTIETMCEEFRLEPQLQVVYDFNKVELGSKFGGDKKNTTKIPILQTWRLNERHYGSWQGQRKPNVLEEYGKKEYMFIRRDYEGKPPPVDLSREMIQQENEKGSSTGYEFKEPNRQVKYELECSNHDIVLPDSESLREVVYRLNPFLQNVILKLATQYDESSCLIVGHGSSVRSLLKILEGISDDDIKNVDIPNGIPLVVELDKNDGLKFIRKYYLDPESAKINAEKVRNEGFEKNP